MRLHRALAVLLTLVITSSDVLVASKSAGLDWPQWRGPERNALSREEGLIEKWGEEGPRILWRMQAGSGFSSVSVSRGGLYTAWDEGDAQYLVDLDAATGRERWRLRIGSAFRHHYGDGPRSTPLVYDGRVYAIGTGGLLLAVDQDAGEILWQRDLVQDFGSRLPSYGYASSPLVSGDKLILEVGGEKGAYAALDRRTGETIWLAESDQPAYSSPIEIEISGIHQVVFWSAHGLHALAVETGDPLWHHVIETFCPVSGDPLNTGTPIFMPPDRILVSNLEGAQVLRILHDGEAFHVETVWKTESLRSDVNTALVTDDRIYGFDRGTLRSLDAATGKVRWSNRDFQRGSLIAADGKLIVLGEQGKLALLSATSSDFVQLATAEVLEGRSWTSPTLAGGRLYLRNQNEIVCIDMRSER